MLMCVLPSYFSVKKLFFRFFCSVPHNTVTVQKNKIKEVNNYLIWVGEGEVFTDDH